MESIRKSKFWENEKKIQIMAIALCVLRIVFQMGIPVRMGAGEVYDDKLLVDYANNLLSGNWLGEYSYTTLNKVPGFGLYLAAMKVVNIPYMLGIGALYALASYLFFMGIRKLVKSEKVSFILFVYVLFSPVMYATYAVTRVYRLSLVPVVVLMLVSSYLLIYVKRKEGWKQILPWSILAGVCLAFYNILREDATWVSCFAYGATLVIVVLLIRENADKVKDKIKKTIIVVLPFIIVFLSVTSLKIVNYNIYGVYATNDFNDTYFAEMTGKILKLQSEYEVEHVWITRGTIEKLYEVSPTFATLQTYLDKLYEGMDTWGYGVLDGEIEVGYSIWTIRWAAMYTGIYTQGAEYTNEFYEKVCNEIDVAIENGELQESDLIVLSNLARPLNLREDTIPCLKYLIKSFFKNITYTKSKYECKIVEATGTAEQIASMANATSTASIGANASAASGYRYFVKLGNCITRVYQYTSWILFFFAFLMFFIEFGVNVYCVMKKKKTNIADWLVKLGILLTIFANLLTVSINYFDAYNGESASVGYTVGIIPLWQVFVSLTVYTFYKYVQKMTEIKRKRYNSCEEEF